jgi:hypothetical protein
MWTIPTWTIRSVWPSCGYSFAVCIFAIKVWFAAFIIGEITAAFEGNGLFAFRAWLRRRTLRTRTTLAAFAAARTFAARTLARRPTFTAITAAHLGALLAQNRLAAQLNAVPFNSQDFHQYLVAFLQFVFHFFHSMFGNLADMQQTIGSRNDFDERAKLSQSHHFAQVRLADFRHRCQIVNALDRALR